MPLCQIHETFYKIECSYCVHELVREEKAEKKADAKRAVILARAKIKSQEAKPKISKQSAKQKVKNLEYSARVKEWKLENPICGARIYPICTRQTEDCHHMKRRDNLLMVEKYWLPVCRNCHQWIGQNSDEARRRCLTINHLEPEFAEPHKI